MTVIWTDQPSMGYGVMHDPTDIQQILNTF